MVPLHSPGLTVQDIDGQTIILDKSRGNIHELNESASFVWHSCNGHASVEDIIEAVHRRFGANRLVIEKDVRSILEQLREMGLVDWQHDRSTDGDQNPKP